MRTTPVNFDGVEGHIVFADEGESFSVVIPDGVSNSEQMRNTVANFVVYLDGEVSLSYERYPQAQQSRRRGQTTFDSTWANPNPGTVTFTVVTPTYSHLCLRRTSGKKLAPVVQSVAAGDSFVIPAASVSVLAFGDMVVAGNALSGIAQVVTSEQTVTAQATSDLLMVHIQKEN